MNRIIKPIFFFAGVLLLSSCATIDGLQHRRETVRIETSGIPARITCGDLRAEAPVTLELAVRRSHTCTAEMEGYESRVFRIESRLTKEGFRNSTRLNRRFGTWTLGAGFLAGWTVDVLSGAMKGFPSREITLELKPAGTTGAVERTANRVIKAADSLIRAPLNAVDQTSDALLDAAVHDAAAALANAGGTDLPEKENREKKE